MLVQRPCAQQHLRLRRQGLMAVRAGRPQHQLLVVVIALAAILALLLVPVRDALLAPLAKLLAAFAPAPLSVYTHIMQQQRFEAQKPSG